MSLSLAWTIHHVVSTCVWFVLFVGYCMQNYLDVLLLRVRDARASRRGRVNAINVKTGMYRVGLLTSIVALIREVDPFASRGIYPSRLPFVLELNLSVMIVVDTAMIIFAAIILSHSSLNKISPWAQRAKVAGIVMTILTFVLANMMWLLEEVTDSAFLGYGLFCWVVAGVYLVEIIIWDLSTLRVVPYFLDLQRTVTENTKTQDVMEMSVTASRPRRERVGSVDVQLVLVMNNLWYFQGFCNLVIFILAPLLIVEGLRTFDSGYAIRLDGQGFQPIRACMLWGQHFVCMATLWFTWRPWGRRLSLSVSRSNGGSRSGSKGHRRERSNWLNNQRMPTFRYGADEKPWSSSNNSTPGTSRQPSRQPSLAQGINTDKGAADYGVSAGPPAVQPTKSFLQGLQAVPEASQESKSPPTVERQVSTETIRSVPDDDDGHDGHDGQMSMTRMASRAMDSVLYGGDGPPLPPLQAHHVEEQSAIELGEVSGRGSTRRDSITDIDAICQEISQRK